MIELRTSPDKFSRMHLTAFQKQGLIVSFRRHPKIKFLEVYDFVWLVTVKGSKERSTFRAIEKVVSPKRWSMKLD